MWKLNGILLSGYGIIPGQVKGEGLAIKGIFDLPKRMGKLHNDWDGHNSVEPYVAADEIFLEGRDIFFQGILEGTKSETEFNIEWLKLDIDGFNNVVPFETPYGTFCVYVKKITSKIYTGIATVLIRFREPEIGAICSIATPGAIFYSDIRSYSSRKNNCPSGYYGAEFSLSTTQGQFTSIYSLNDANAKADAWLLENVQAYANNASESTYCLLNPPVYFNAELTGYLQKDDCQIGYIGETVSYTIDYGVYSSDGRFDPTASQEKADAKAQAALDAVLTQEYANINGKCDANPTFRMTYNVAEANRIRYIRLEVGPAMIMGTTYTIMLYGVATSFTTGFDPQRRDVLDNLVTLFNSKTVVDWNPLNMAPMTGTPGFPPYAERVGRSEILITTSYYGFATPVVETI